MRIQADSGAFGHWCPNERAGSVACSACSCLQAKRGECSEGVKGPGFACRERRANAVDLERAPVVEGEDESSVCRSDVGHREGGEVDQRRTRAKGISVLVPHATRLDTERRVDVEAGLLFAVMRRKGQEGPSLPHASFCDVLAE
jgi:hypothetical protein